MTLLDVGCGKPSFLLQAVRRFSLHGVGVDFSDHGWSDTVREYSELQLQVSDPKEIDLQVRPDLITMWHYLEHDYDPILTLEHLRNLASDDCTLLVEVPDHDSWTRRRYGQKWAGYHTPRHTALYTKDTLSQLLRRSGWSVERVDQIGTLDAYTLDWMSRMEIKDIDWTASMQPHFWPFVWGKLVRPRFFGNQRGLGFLTAVAKIGR